MNLQASSALAGQVGEMANSGVSVSFGILPHPALSRWERVRLQPISERFAGAWTLDSSRANPPLPAGEGRGKGGAPGLSRRTVFARRVFALVITLLGVSLVSAAEQAPEAWKEYNAAIEAYRSGDFATADEAWQRLSMLEMPDELRSKVWFQAGNSAFRIGERTLKGEPENSLRDWMRAREAFRVAAARGPLRNEAKANLDLVERNVVRLNLDLSSKLETSTKNQSVEKTVELFQAASVYAHQALEIAPDDAESKTAVKRTETGLKDALQKKARQEEKKADDALKRGNQWDISEAKKHFNAALTDLDSGLALAPKDGVLNSDRARIAEKLAKLHVTVGDAEKKRGDQSAQWDVDEAEKRYRSALEEFDESLAVKQFNNPEAERGREDVLKALERLQIKEADMLAKQGREDIPRNAERAADELGEAAERYQEAMNLNPENAETPPKLDAARKDLSPLLESLGRKEQQRAQQAEKRSTQEAVQHLEKAQSAFDRAQQSDPKNEGAQQGAQQVQSELERLRQKLAQAEQGNQGEQGQKAKQAKDPKAAQDLAEMMEELKREQSPEHERQRRRQDRFNPPPVRTTRNW